MDTRWKILVCIKQVPDSGDTLRIDASTGRIQYGPFTVFRMNRFDEFALEEALVMKERMPGTMVHALSLGPERVKATIKRALEMGADHGIYLSTPDEINPGPRTTASLIASYAKGKNYNLILAGVMAEDDMACQVGQLTAALLDLPCATSVIREEIDREGTVCVEREIEGGSRAILSMNLPAVLTIQSGINAPRYPSLSNVLRARTQALEMIDARDLQGFAASDPPATFREPDKTMEGIFIQGTQREKARTIRTVLHEKGFI